MNPNNDLKSVLKPTNFEPQITTSIDTWGRSLIRTVKEQFAIIQDNLAILCDTIDSNTTLMKNDLLDKITKTDVRVETVEGVANANKIAIKSLQDELNDVKKTCSDLEKENSFLKEKVGNIDSYSRLDNLIFTGFRESPNEDDQKCASLVRSMLINKLSMSEQYVQSVRFVRCHRLRPNSNQTGPRSIIVRFANYDDRMKVWKAREKLTTREYTIHTDQPRYIDARRRKLYPLFNAIKESPIYRDDVQLSGDKLVIKKKKYDWSTIGNLSGPIHPRNLCVKSDNDTIAFGGIYSEFTNLSNFSKCKFTHNNKQFTSVEQCFQFHKAEHFNDTAIAKQLLSASPGKAKFLSGKINNFDPTRWNVVKDNLMSEIILSKFSQSEALKKELIATAEKQLVECGSDTYWASGLRITHADVLIKNKWIGNNKLGEILMNTRAQLR